MTRVVAAVIVRVFPDGVARVLASRRRHPPALAGRWEFPGGKVEPGEDDLTAVRREIAEELGIAITVHGPLGDQLPMIGVGHTGFWQPFLAVAHGEPQLIDHAEHRWLAAAELDELPWLTSDVPVLPRVKDALDLAAAP